MLEPIYSTAVWGAGWYNAADAAHYADAAIRYEGSIDFELQGSADVWDFMGDWAVNQRAYSRSLDISPDGARVYHYRATTNSTYDLNGAWCTELGLNTSEGSFVMASAGLMAITRDESDPAGGHNYSDYSYIEQKKGVIASSCALLSTTFPLNPGGTNINPIPFWRTNASLFRGAWSSSSPFGSGTLPQTGIETVEWSITASNNTLPLYTCNGTRLPSAILQGPMSVSGDVTLYHVDGVFDPILGPTGTEGNLTQPYMVAENTWLRIEINNGTNNVYLLVPAVVIESDTYDIAGADSVTNRSFSVKGLGGRCGPSNTTLPPFVMSDSSGAFVAP